MPTYDYQCSQCQHVQEEHHMINEKLEVKCRECGASCEKIFSPTKAFILKGGGWPSTDARFKKNMLDKNDRMKRKMHDREVAGQGVRRTSDLIKHAI